MARNILTLIFITTITKISLFLNNAAAIHRHAFIQTDNELRYLVDGISLHLHENLGNDGEFSIPNANEMATSQTYSSPIVLFPAVLDFKESPIGMPRLARVIVSNPNYHINVFLLSISGNSVNFHCSFFQDKVISPGGNTTFDVVFLSRHEGAVQNTLYIHTSVGSFKYQVLGIGTPNPYRLRPLLGAKVPINSIYSPIISMYNPHSSTLQITEMYSSGGDLHLELPNGEKEASKHLWEIAPYETKPVMKANFLAKEANNHTAYIRIKTNTSHSDYLVLPVEVEVSAASGLYSTTDSLEFGVMYSKDAPKSLVLSLLNHSQKPVLISSVSVNPYNKAVTVDFQPLKISSNTGVAVQVAVVTFNPKLAVDANSCSGNVIVRTKSSQFKLAIKYHATVLQGVLEYNSSNLEFYVGDAAEKRGEFQKNLTLKNSFNVSVVIFDFVLSEEAKSHFSVILNEGIVLHPNQTVIIGSVTLKKCNDLTLFDTFLKLRTNISDFEIPLLCYNGKLTPYVPLAKSLSENLLDIGTLSVREKRDVLIAVINGNPVNVYLRRFGASLVHVVVELLAVHNKNISELMDKMSFSGMAKTLVLAPSHFAIFRVGISAPSTEETFNGEVFIETVFETLRIPISFKTAVGALSVVPSQLQFQHTFPGKVSIVKLYVQSTFSTPMTVLSIISLRDDGRFTYIPMKNSPVLLPNSKTMVGSLQFDARNDCDNYCYLGFDTNSPIGNRWLSSFKLQYGIASVDVDLFQNLWSKWSNLSANKLEEQNVTFVLDTTEVHGFLFQSLVSLIWPKLAVKSRITFPLTQIGNFTMEELVLENTANLPVVVQVIPLFAYPHPSAIMSLLMNNSFDGFLNLLTYNESAFRLHNNHSSIRRTLPPFLQGHSHSEGMIMFLNPGERIHLPIIFTPAFENEVATFLLIRNNLTVLEAVYLHGSGSHCEMRFGSRAPGSSIPLQFELTEKHLKDCENSPFPQYALPNFAVRRAFTVRNTGLLPIYVSGFDISSSNCEGYGFRVLNCQGFLLSPNSSKKIDIAFTPDFTLARVQRELIVHTSMGSGGQTLSFILLATIPPYLLSRCASILPRPQWEVMLYYVTVCLMIFVLLGVLVTAYLESDRIIRYTFVAMTVTAIPDISKSSFPPNSEPFDLKRIAVKGLNTTNSGRSQVVEQSFSSNNRTENVRGRKTGYSQINSSSDSNVTRTQNYRSLLQQMSGDINKPVERKVRDTSCLSEFVTTSKKSVKLKKVKSSSLIDRNLNNANNSFESTNSNMSCKRNRKHSQETNEFSANQDDKSSSSSSSVNSENDKSGATNSKNKRDVCDLRCSKGKCNWLSNSKKDKNCTRLATEESKKKPVNDATEEDTSSTTTESSSPDFDSSEKEPQGKETKRWYEKEKRITSSPKVDDADDDDASNGAWIRQTCEHRNSHRTRISSPVVELPYKLNTCRTSDNKSWLNCDNKDQGTKTKNRSYKKLGNSDTFTKMNNDGESSSTGKDSPPPLWDPASPFSNIDDAYDKLAKTTETFALRRKSYLNSDKSSLVKKRANSQDKRYKVNREQEKEVTESLEKWSSLFENLLPEPKKRTKDQLSRVIGAVGQKPISNLSLSVKTDHWSTGGNMDTTSPILGTPCTPPDYPGYPPQSFLNYDQLFARHPVSSSASPSSHWKPQVSTSFQLESLLPQPRETSNEPNCWSSYDDRYLSGSVWNSDNGSNNVWSPLNGYDMTNEVGVGPMTESYNVGIWNDPRLDALHPIGWPSPSNQWSSTLANSSSSVQKVTNNEQETLSSASEYNPFNTLPTIWTPATSSENAGNDDWQSSSLFLPRAENNKH